MGNITFIIMLNFFLLRLRRLHHKFVYELFQKQKSRIYMKRIPRETFFRPLLLPESRGGEGEETISEDPSLERGWKRDRTRSRRDLRNGSARSKGNKLNCTYF